MTPRKPRRKQKKVVAWALLRENGKLASFRGDRLPVIFKTRKDAAWEIDNYELRDAVVVRVSISIVPERKKP